MPLRGAIPRDARLARTGYRFLEHSPYLVFYKVRGRAVVVCRVLHGRRAWWTLLR
jgi:plasmid stabilization system protein ParE